MVSLIEEWRFIFVDTVDGPTGVAISEAITLAMSKNVVPNTILFWRVKSPFICLGRNQLVKEEVHEAACKQLEVGIVRRTEGGGAGYCDENQILYSIIVNKGHLKIPYSIEGAYTAVLKGVNEGLMKLGLTNTSFEPKLQAVFVNGKKVSGNAQTSFGGVTVVSGSFLVKFDYKTMCKVLKEPIKNLKGEIKTPEEGLTYVSRELGRSVSIKEAKEALKQGFEKALHVRLIPRKLANEELRLVEELKSKYASHEWTYYMDIKERKRQEFKKKGLIQLAGK